MHILIIATKSNVNDKLCMNNSQTFNNSLRRLVHYINVNINKQRITINLSISCHGWRRTTRSPASRTQVQQWQHTWPSGVMIVVLLGSRSAGCWRWPSRGSCSSPSVTRGGRAGTRSCRVGMSVMTQHGMFLWLIEDRGNVEFMQWKTGLSYLIFQHINVHIRLLILCITTT